MWMVRESRDFPAYISRYLEIFQLAGSHHAGEYSMGTFNNLVTGQTNSMMASKIDVLTVSSSAKGSTAERSFGCSKSRRKCSLKDVYAFLESHKGFSQVD